MNHIIELKQTAEAHQLGQFNQHGIPSRQTHGLPSWSQQPDGNEQDDIQKDLHPEGLHPVGPERRRLDSVYEIYGFPLELFTKPV